MTAPPLWANVPVDPGAAAIVRPCATIKDPPPWVNDPLDPAPAPTLTAPVDKVPPVVT